MNWGQDSRSFPVIAVEDRYGGTYSGGQWIAIAGFCVGGPSESLLAALAADDADVPSPWAQDIPAQEFWSDPPNYVAVGNTPDEAVRNLNAKDSG